MNGPWWLPDKIDALYGAIAGGFIAFLSSFLTNRHSLKRQKIELTHQAQESEKERQHALKRETYLPLLEAVSAAVNFVVQVPTMPIEKLNSDNPVGELGKEISKLNLVAPPEVMEPVTRGQTHLVKVYMVLTNERLAIQSLAGELANIDSNIAAHSIRQKSVLDRFERHVDQGTGDQGLRQILTEFYGNEGKEIAAFQKRRQIVLKQKCNLELNLLRRASQEIKPIRSHAVAALLAIRRDLGTQINDNWWIGFMEANAMEIDAALEKFYADLESRIREAFSDVPVQQSAPATKSV